MAQQFSLLSLVFMISFVILFDGMHYRNRRNERLRAMYIAVLNGAAGM